jgi:hypothetical protein
MLPLAERCQAVAVAGEHSCSAGQQDRILLLVRSDDASRAPAMTPPTGRGGSSFRADLTGQDRRWIMDGVELGEAMFDVSKALLVIGRAGRATVPGAAGVRTRGLRQCSQTA